ncbi:alpha/beta hydrolase [Streptomyces sp. NRRL S-87]|uniref:alpha/beta hydrolase n=1 Tax=Streptomyces sp. NRRL S-87 TaxID=1463920 RepID=UPI0004BEB125|nr:alpha/beta hydrolase [Streptomyces sp. NRRL S-87]
MTPRPVRLGRLRRALLAALVAGAVAVPVSAAALPSAPAPAPVRFADGTPPAARYAANRADVITAARMAEVDGRGSRAAKLLELAGGNLLSFDGRGEGRVVEVFGDLSRAERVAVLVPGSDTTLDTYGRFRAGARALSERLRAQGQERVAVVAWLGYETPGTVSPSVLTSGRADDAAGALEPFLDELGRLTPHGTGVALLCHSYGSVVCARTATPPSVTDVVLFGSPGTGADRAAQLPTSARVWAGRGADDWIANVPHLRLELPGTTVGFGTDPVDPAFGARVFPAGPGGHSDYLKPGSFALDQLTHIAAGSSPALD